MKCGLRATCYVARNCRGSVLQTSRRWCGLLRLSLVGKAAKDMCRQLFRALAGSFQDCGAFLVPTQWTWTVACTSSTQPSPISLYSRALHQRPSGSDTCLASPTSRRHGRALRSALCARHSMVRGCCAARTQETTRRRLRVVQGSHRPSLCPPLAKTWKAGPAEHAAIAGKEAMGSTLFVRC